MSDKCYSINEEEYSYDDIYDAIEAFVDGCSDEEIQQIYDGEITIYEGDALQRKASDFLSFNVYDNLQDNAYEEAGEYSEGWLDNLTDEQYDELQNNIKKVINDWADKHKKQPTFWTVENVKQLRVKVKLDKENQIENYEIIENQKEADS